jgi:hypothetical protein
MRLDWVDVYFLHSNICADDFVRARQRAPRSSRRRGANTSTRLSRLRSAPGEQAHRRVGITGIGVPGTILGALGQAPKPAVVQAIANLLDSPGGIRHYAEPARPRDHRARPRRRSRRWAFGRCRRARSRRSSIAR